MPINCGNRFCPICSRPRRVRAARRLRAIIKRVHPHKPATLKQLTLTISNSVSADAGVRYVVASFRRLRQRSFWRRYVLGGAYVVHVSGSPGKWHCHLHIALESKFIPWSKLLKQWQSCSGGQGVYIQELTKDHLIAHLSTDKTNGSLPEAHQKIVSVALRDTRLFQPFGSWHNIKVRIVHPDFVCPKCRSTSWYPAEHFNERNLQRAGLLHPD